MVNHSASLHLSRKVKTNMAVETIDLLSELVNIDRTRKELKSDLDTLNQERAVIEARILDIWEKEGTTQQKVDGSTIYLHGQKWAKPLDGNRAAVVKALEFLGMHDFVNFNTQSLSGYFRECEKNDTPVPDELASVIEFSEDWKVKVRL
jgi:hypothetical protein